MFIRFSLVRRIWNHALAVAMAILLISHSTLAIAATGSTCYPLAHGENGQGSTNSLYLPHLITIDKWDGFVLVTNTSDKFVNVKLQFSDYSGADYLPTSYTFWGMFNSGNSPFALSTGGAILKPRETGRVRISDEGNPNALFGRISWQADACIDSALLVSVRSHFNDGNLLASDLSLLNNGQPF